jgi:uncharacterized protein DUF1579
MRSLVLVSALLTAAAIAASLSTAVARQDDDQGTRTLLDLNPQEIQAAQMKAMELAGPGAEHAMLAKYAGDFDLQITLWMGAGATPQTSSGTAVHQMVLGGRFLRINSEMKVMGFDTESLLLWGFDRRDGKFTSVGFDTMGTYSVTAQGPYDPQTKTITFSGTDTDPALRITQVFDFEVELVDGDTMKTSIIYHDMFQAGPFKMMETISRRRVAASDK